MRPDRFKKRVGALGEGLTPTVTDATYSAADIVGMTLIAKGKVIAYDEPYDVANIVNTYNPGDAVGVVVSWEDVNSAIGRSHLFWQFLDTNGTYYYIPQLPGEFSTQDLADQGVLNAAQKTIAAEKASESVFQQEFEKYAPWVIGGVLAVFALKEFLKRS